MYINIYILYRTERNPNVQRKFVQTSVVVLTPLAYVGLFKQLIQLVGPLYFEKGPSVLEDAWRIVASWPRPRAGLALTFELEGHSFHAITPIQFSVTAMPSRLPELQSMAPSPGMRTGRAKESTYSCA